MKKSYFFLMLLSLSLMSCSFSSTKNSFESLDVEEFAAFIANPDVQLVDVRTAEEHAAGHIPGSVNIDIYGGHEQLVTSLDPERPVALYCRSGRRSKEAAFVLESVFFSQVVELDGGYNGWVEAGR